jgi:hypothetical protein
MCFDCLVMNCMLLALLVSLANFVGLQLRYLMMYMYNTSDTYRYP